MKEGGKGGIRKLEQCCLISPQEDGGGSTLDLKRSNVAAVHRLFFWINVSVRAACFEATLKFLQ